MGGPALTAVEDADGRAQIHSKKTRGTSRRAKAGALPQEAGVFDAAGSLVQAKSVAGAAGHPGRAADDSAWLLQPRGHSQQIARASQWRSRPLLGNLAPPDF